MKIEKSAKSSKANEVTYEILEDFGLLEAKGNWETRFRRISWNGKTPVYDIRPWKDDPDRGEICGKGITLSGEAVEKLLNILNS